jgi:AraC family transcriptional regulator
LQSGNQPVTGIAFDAGYETHESFTRAFRAMFGTSPTLFRKAQRELFRPLAPSGIHYLPDGRPDDFTPVQRGGSPMEVRIETLAPQKVAFLRHVGPYEGVSQTWCKLEAWAGQHGLLGPGTKLIGISHDNPHVTPAEKLRYDACIATDQPFEPVGEIGVQEIPGGEYVVVTHRGPYEKLADTYAWLYGDWLPQSGREPAESPGFQLHHNTPPETPPEDLVTDIYVPLKPR